VAWWIRGRGGGFMWRLVLCVSRGGRNGWAWPRWLALSARRLRVFWGVLGVGGVWVVGALKFI